MNYIPSNTILITSDGSIIRYIKTENVKGKEILYWYRFIESNNEYFTKKDLEFTMTESFIKRQLSNYFKIIE